MPCTSSQKNVVFNSLNIYPFSFIQKGLSYIFLCTFCHLTDIVLCQYTYSSHFFIIVQHSSISVEWFFLMLVDELKGWVKDDYLFLNLILLARMIITLHLFIRTLYKRITKIILTYGWQGPAIMIAMITRIARKCKNHSIYLHFDKYIWELKWGGSWSLL